MVSERVLVGAFSMEANSFLSAMTTQADFERQVWVVGERVDRDAAGPANELAGAWDAICEAGMTPVGTIAAMASPGPPVAAEAFAEVLEQIRAGCDLSQGGAPIGGIYLMCHGSALVVGEDDPEGALLEAVREQVGPGVPIAVSLDLHGYLTDRMLRNADIITAYRTCPHVDLYRTGRQAGAILARAVRGEVRPILRRVRLPMITPPEHHDDTHGPFPVLQGMCEEAEASGALAAALLCTQPWLDVTELGWNAVVTTDADPELAQSLAQWLAGAAWQARHAFMVNSAVGITEAVDQALEAAAPFVIADIGDATNGGAMGDSTVLLRELLARQLLGRPAGPAALSVADPVAAAAAIRAGIGATVTLMVGTGPEDSYNEATPLTGRVHGLWDGELTYAHPAAHLVPDSAGPAAIIQAGQVSVILHSRPVRVIDPAIYLAAGIDLPAQQILQAKSHVSYRAGFDPVTTGSILADTPGPTAANLMSLPFTRRPRPLFPFEDAIWPGGHSDPGAMESAPGEPAGE